MSEEEIFGKCFQKIEQHLIQKNQLFSNEEDKKEEDTFKKDFLSKITRDMPLDDYCEAFFEYFSKCLTLDQKRLTKIERELKLIQKDEVLTHE